MHMHIVLHVNILPNITRLEIRFCTLHLKNGCFENEDLRKRRPKMGLRNYENEDPLRKRRPIFVFVLRKRRP